MSETAIIESLGVIFTIIGAIVSYFLAKTDKEIGRASCRERVLRLV